MTVVLAGNGLSIAYNPELAIPQLTQRVMGALDRDGSSDAAILRSFASDTGAERSDLEAVLGALDQIALALPPLRELSALGGSGNETAQAITATAEALNRLYRFGIGTALDAIVRLAHSRPSGFAATDALLDSLTDDLSLTIATLNYDGLLTSRVLERRYAFDLASGYPSDEDSFTVVTRGRALNAHRLRRADDMNNPTVVLNLHGSAGWLWHPEHNWWRFTLDELRRQQYWLALTQGQTPWTPAVVLTNQHRKSQLVGQYPFSLAYEAFTRRLRSDSRLIIVGYSFGDQYLNALLRDEVNQHPRAIALAVITHGPDPGDELVHNVLSPRVEIFRGGVEATIDDLRWTRWVSSSATC